MWCINEAILSWLRNRDESNQPACPIEDSNKGNRELSASAWRAEMSVSGFETLLRIYNVSKIFGSLKNILKIMKWDTKWYVNKGNLIRWKFCLIYWQILKRTLSENWKIWVFSNHKASLSMFSHYFQLLLRIKEREISFYLT